MILNLQAESANNMLGLLLEQDQILRHYGRTKQTAEKLVCAANGKPLQTGKNKTF